MTAHTIINVLLIVGAILAGIMSYLARASVPTPSSSTRKSSRTDHPFAKQGSHRSYRRYATEGLGRDYGTPPHGGYETRRDRRRPDAYDTFAEADRRQRSAEEAFEEWAGANGFGSWRESVRDSAATNTPAGLHWSTVLGVSKNASTREIRAAYANTMRRLHPDVVGEDSLTTKRCTEARIAYEEGRREAEAAERF
ncbi:J domain-containing protein [Sphingomonas sp. 3-13AW]|uniref:J domain-containing protein n=1 Tax=Sphingomonas sp. 3-13AW TaxID=3050450 RepID=UPI003BB623EE